jgi:hypothetical protein
MMKISSRSRRHRMPLPYHAGSTMPRPYGGQVSGMLYLANCRRHRPRSGLWLVPRLMPSAISASCRSGEHGRPERRIKGHRAPCRPHLFAQVKNRCTGPMDAFQAGPGSKAPVQSSPTTETPRATNAVSQCHIVWSRQPDRYGNPAIFRHSSAASATYARSYCYLCMKYLSFIKVYIEHLAYVASGLRKPLKTANFIPRREIFRPNSTHSVELPWLPPEITIMEPLS